MAWLSQKKERRPGRPSALSDSEMLTILILCTACLRMKHLKSVYDFIVMYHREDFPKLPDYSSFVRHCQRLIPLMWKLLENSLAKDAKLRFADSTMLPVCKYIRANNHKVCKGIAAFGKNWQGWHYGFKLHASINKNGQFTGLYFTPANEHDAQQLPHLVKGGAKIVVGDTTYGARVMKEHLWKTKGVFILAPPHPKQGNKVLAKWQELLLKARPKIECAFDYLKEHMHLVSSFPRSVAGYLFHYLRVLLAYQAMFLPSTC
jgi:hypothetical protein